MWPPLLQTLPVTEGREGGRKGRREEVGEEGKHIP